LTSFALFENLFNNGTTLFHPKIVYIVAQIMPLIIGLGNKKDPGPCS